MAKAFERVQVAVCPDIVQLQPVPEALVALGKDRPVGRVSVTVTRPLVGRVPELVTVIL